MNKFLLTMLLIPLALYFAACGDSGDDLDFGSEQGGEQAGESGQDNVDDAVTAPVTKTEFFGTSGNLYKPVSDDHSSSPGNMVVLLGPHYTKRFDTCEIPVQGGGTAQLDCNDRAEWTHEPFSCFANGGRQHWRGYFSCSNVTQIKVTCKDATQTVVFTVPDAQLGSVCTRFG